MRGYEDLEVWRKAMDLAAMIYALEPLMPKSELYGMTSQMQRAASSVPANIAEGYQRGTRKDYARFIGSARGSLAETETFLILAIRVKRIPEAEAHPCLEAAREVGRMLTRLKQRLDSPSPWPPAPTLSPPAPAHRAGRRTSGPCGGEGSRRCRR